MVKFHFIFITQSLELLGGIFSLTDAQFEGNRKLNILQVFRVSLDNWINRIQILIDNSRDMDDKNNNKYYIQNFQ